MLGIETCEKECYVSGIKYIRTGMQPSTRRASPMSPGNHEQADNIIYIIVSGGSTLPNKAFKLTHHQLQESSSKIYLSTYL